MKENILISTGGSGGHVVPAQTLYEHLKDEFNVFLTSDLRGSKFFENNNKNFKIINVLPLTQNIFFSLQLCKSALVASATKQLLPLLIPMLETTETPISNLEGT